ncbi:pyridoxamine 5'-phosphate oxidase family protein [Paenibacillus tyrfis]|uniref:pyridoxamine 5'-phosphate oxidase family protein n=1 Tax=Paenibacillus tyrfis TaxID=1501230 RepID=UPI000B58AFC4|nr:pyridoxamine 5'-phosphate oxidase family protein [Paenibacillus tyrfis]
MRRKEFAMTEAENKMELETFLNEMSFGFLGTIGADGKPSVTPLNYVYHHGSIYFHGSRIGEKMNNLSLNEEVTFVIAKEYAIIPSYFEDPLLACPATAYYKSVRIDGRAVAVSDLREKADALEVFMRKLQPEGGYKTIDADDPDYSPRLKGVGLVRIDADHTSGKFKFGQNLKEPVRNGIIEGLAERGLLQDAETIELMRRYCLHANKD